MLKQREICKAVVNILREKFNKTVYTDEVVERFKRSCFFIKIIKQSQPETINFNSNSISIIITYFSKEKNYSLDFMDVQDIIQETFQMGFWVGERHLLIQEINKELLGEENDILQLTLNIDYYDSTGYDYDSGYDLLQNIYVDTTVKDSKLKIDVETKAAD